MIIILSGNQTLHETRGDSEYGEGAPSQHITSPDAKKSTLRIEPR